METILRKYVPLWTAVISEDRTIMKKRCASRAEINVEREERWNRKKTYLQPVHLEQIVGKKNESNDSISIKKITKH